MINSIANKLIFYFEYKYSMLFKNYSNFKKRMDAKSNADFMKLEEIQSFLERRREAY